MAAEILSIDPDVSDSPELKRASQALAAGALVAFPTETVYGLAANASDEASVNRLRDVKGRAATQPFTVHIGRGEDIDLFVPTVSNVGRRIIQKGWPGPLTLVFPIEDTTTPAIREKLSAAGMEAIYGRGSVGLRFPDHAAGEGFLRGANVPVIASSANRTGESPPYDAPEIRAQLGDEVDIILDAGPTRYRKGSTIIELNGDGFKVLREGVWDERTVRRLTTVNVLFVCTGNTCRSPIAEGLFRKMMAERVGCTQDELSKRGVSVLSAGTSAFGGSSASPESVEVCRKRGVDISHHASQPLTHDLVLSADYIFGMTSQHIDSVRRMIPRAASKATVLSSRGDIADPVGGPMAEYERAAVEIEQALALRLDEVRV